MKTTIDQIVKVVKPSKGGGQSGDQKEPKIKTKTLGDQEPNDGSVESDAEKQGSDSGEGSEKAKVKTMDPGSIGKRNVVERRSMPNTGQVLSPTAGQNIAKELGLDPGKPATEGDWKKAAKSAVQTHLTPRSRMAGSGNNGNIYQKIMDLVEPKINWREELSRYIGDYASEPDFKMPARRGVGRDEFRYGMYDKETAIENAVVCLDVSGSVANSFPELAAEVVGIASAKEIETISVVPFADTVVDPFKVENFRIPTAEDFEKVRTGGGSEAINKVIQWIDAEAPNPDFVVIVTDGYLTNGVPNQAPSWGTKTIWLIFDNPRFNVPDSWGRIIHANGDPGYWNAV
jgi:hypothetical protein